MMRLLQQIPLYWKWQSTKYSYMMIDENIPDSAKILDVGSGYGLLAHYLGRKPMRKIWAVDISKKRIQYSHIKKSPNVHFICQDATKIKSKDFDVIIMSDFLHHLSLKKQNEVIKNARKQLKRDGLILIKEVQKDYLAPGFWFLYCFDLFFNIFKPLFYQTKQFYTSKIKENGFKIVKCDDDHRSVWGEFLLIGQKL